MKKILVSLLVLALCAPAMAATVTVVDNADGTGTVTIAAEGGDENMVGLGLDIDVTGGNVTVVTVDTANFNIYPDAAYTEELGDGYAYGEGTPVAAKTVPGEISLPQTSFALSFGNLNGEAVAGADGAASVQLTITVDADVTITIAENATRGGIVGITGQDIDISSQTGTTITIGAAECMKNTHPDYATWVTYGMPDCWCYAKQCKGDVDGKPQFGGAVDIYTDDIDIFLPAFGAGLVTTVPGVCADIDHGTQFGGAVNVYTDDLDILLPNFGTPVSDCDMTHFNFWIPAP